MRKNKGYSYLVRGIVAYIISVYICYDKLPNQFDFCSLNIVKFKKRSIASDSKY